jgi:hypothetical protein
VAAPEAIILLQRGRGRHGRVGEVYAHQLWRSNYLTSRYSEHKEAAAKLEARVRLRPIYTSAGRAHP